MTDLQWYVAITILANLATSVVCYLMLRSIMVVRFEALNQRFEDMRDVWRAELQRVERVLDVRLRALAERRR